MSLLRALLGIVGFCFLCWCLSSERRRFPWRVVLFSLALQFVFGVLADGDALGKVFGPVCAP